MGKQLRNLEVVKTPEYMLEAQKLTSEMLAQLNTEFDNATKAKHITLQRPIEVKSGQLVEGKLNVILKDKFLGRIIGQLVNINCVKPIKYPTWSDLIEEKDGKMIATAKIEFGLYEADFCPSDSDYSIPFIFETEQDFERQLLAVLEIDPTAQ